MGYSLDSFVAPCVTFTERIHIHGLVEPTRGPPREGLAMLLQVSMLRSVRGLARLPGVRIENTTSDFRLLVQCLLEINKKLPMEIFTCVSVPKIIEQHPI